MDKWLLIHRYNRLVTLGVAGPLECPDCRARVAIQLADDEEPMLWCLYCDTKMTPGLDFWHDIRAVVSEHYLE